MSEYLTVSEAARELSSKAGAVVPPRSISDLFYRRRLSDDRCPIVGGRRLIPRNYLPDIEAILQESSALGLALKGADHAE